ncbi:hypothetical protein [Paenibacillus sp. 1P07SE]|uniref:hypothetical protein n=1 Tax=Paenibacillus sp. 1P07SE TaxID=3132209 RepID=UPI0039A626F6
MNGCLLEVEGTLTPLGSKMHITYQFEIHQAVPIVLIEFKYAPKSFLDKEASYPLIMDAIERFTEPERIEAYHAQWENYYPLQNLLTLSIDGPDGFRGSAHRHAPEQQHAITGDSRTTSPGLIPGPITPGVWKITVSVHCVVSPQCHYALSVRGEAPDEMDSI